MVNRHHCLVDRMAHHSCRSLDLQPEALHLYVLRGACCTLSIDALVCDGGRRFHTRCTNRRAMGLRSFLLEAPEASLILSKLLLPFLRLRITRVNHVGKLIDVTKAGYAVKRSLQPGWTSVVRDPLTVTSS